MFSKSSRPVPSRAALRVLYQLAYISSGTAVGVAALCAEERRRRTHYVQKIADNAKRLRQSPRHVHNVAAARKVRVESVEGQDSGHDGDFWEEQSLDDRSQNYRVGESSENVRVGKRLVRGSDLPSTVERGYAQVTKGQKRGRRRGTHEERTTQPGAGQPRTTPHDTGSTTTYTPYRPVFAQGKEPSELNLARFRIAKVEPSIQPRPKFAPLRKVVELVERPGGGSFRKDVRGADVVRRNAALFFKSVPWTSSELTTEAQAAGRLLSEAVRYGCLPEVRQLVSWKLANDKLDESDVNILHDGLSSFIIAEPNHLDVFELFAELFGSKAFNELPEEFKLSRAISVAAEAIDLDIEMSELHRAKHLLTATLESSRRDRIDDVIRQLYNRFLAASDVRKAYNVISSARTGLSNPDHIGSASVFNRRYKQDYEKIIDQAKRQDQLWICQKYAALLAQARDDPDRIPFIEWILSEYRRRKAYVPARKLTLTLIRYGDWKALNDQAKTNLAIALSVINKKNVDGPKLEELYRSIPDRLRGPVIEAWCADRLRMVWKAQQDLEAVRMEYERAKTFQFERFGTAELTFIEICNKAGQPNRALRLLSGTLQHESHNNLSLCIAAVSMARKSAWKQLRALIHIIAESGKFVNDVSTSNNLNVTIELYSHKHTAAETWKFVTDLITVIGFAPNKSTTDIMFRCFVSQKSLELIPKWIRYLRTIGNDFHMNATSATKLLSCFYYDQRPPHVLLMWFSRNLANKWPQFDAGQLRNLIRTSIGYDLRKLPVQDKASLRERAEQNLARLAAPGRALPKPYRKMSEAEDLESSLDVPTSEPQVDDDLLGPHYHALRSSHGEVEADLDMTDASTEEPEPTQQGRLPRGVVKKMILALSLRNYSQVMDLYKSSLSSTGLPVSTLALEVATEASIRIHKGDITEATSMLDAAKNAGMEVRRAMGPLLVHRLHSLDPAEKRDANAIRTMVIDYYRSNEENGFPVQHHVGITAANTLINNQRAEYGINILNAIYHSEWVLERPLDIVAMTVYLKGYATIRSRDGIEWVMRRVLKGNMPVDRPFIVALKSVCKSFGIDSVVRRSRTKFDRTNFIAKLRAGRQECIARRYRQRFQAKKFGNLLVKRILQCVAMERQPTVELEKREELEETFFEGPIELEGGHDEEEGRDDLPGASDMQADGRETGLDRESTAKPTRLEIRRAKARLAMANRLRGEERASTTKRTLRQTHYSQWLEQYRAFIKRDLILADGKLASFRRYVV